MINLHNVSKAYKDNVVLNEVSFEFEEGFSYAITGDNGAGKSVLLKIISGFARADLGSVNVSGVTLGVDRDFIDGGVSINHPEFYPLDTGMENLKTLLKIRGSDDSFMVELIRELSMENNIHKQYRTYSLGMRQKMRLIQALMEAPQYLILDEPFDGLDSKSREKALEIVKSYLKADGNRVLIFTSHAKGDLDYLADSILEISDGHLKRIV